MCLLPTPGAPKIRYFYEDDKLGKTDPKLKLIDLENCAMLTDEHESFPFKRRELNNLLIRNHIQLVKNCKNMIFVVVVVVLDKA